MQSNHRDTEAVSSTGNTDYVVCVRCGGLRGLDLRTGAVSDCPDCGYPQPIEPEGDN